jgi:hypothetical protein
MIYESNLSQVIDKLKNGLLSPETQDKIARTISLNLFASNQRRVNNEGLDVNMKNIGSYSTRPIYVNPKNSPVKFTPKTKVKKNPVTRYFGGGYREFRGFIGRPNEKVTVDLSHKLRNEWRIFFMRTGNYTIGFQSEYGKEVSRGNEAHFKTTIWGITSQDRKMIAETVKSFVSATS